MKKIDIIGWYNRSNVGDEAFRLVFSQWFNHSHIAPSEEYDVRFVTPPEFTRADADLVILGGGAVVSDYYMSKIVKTNAAGEEIPRIAVGVDTQHEKELDLLFEHGFKYIVFRDQDDLNLFEKLAHERNEEVNAEFCPDLAFTLDTKGFQVLTRFARKKRKVIAVFATDYVMAAKNRDLYFFGPRGDQFAEGLGQVLDHFSEKYEILLLPCSTGETGNDLRVNRHIAAFMHHKPTIVETALTPQQLIDLIDDCAVTVCMRYHAHIFSIIAGTPFVSIEFTKKVAHVVEEYDRALINSGHSRTTIAVSRTEDKYFNFDEAIKSINEALYSSNMRDERKTLRRFAKNARKLVENARNRVLEHFKQPG